MKLSGFYLFIGLLITQASAGQQHCDLLHKKFTDAYASTIRQLHYGNPQKGDSIYQIFAKAYDSLQCQSYPILSKYINAYSHLLFYGLKDHQRAKSFLLSWRERMQGVNDSLYVMLSNNIALYELQDNNYPMMKHYLTEATHIAESRLDPVFFECTRTTYNMAMYYDWLNQENQSIKIMQKSVDLIQSKKITGVNFRYETYESMYGYFLELENEPKAKVFLDSIYALTLTQASPKKERWTNHYYELLLRYHLHFSPRAAAIDLFNTKLNNKPDNLDYDHIMLYLPLLAETGQLKKMKSQLDTLQYLFDKRPLPPDHFYRVRKLRYDIMYYKTIGHQDTINVILQKIASAFNNNLYNIIYTSEYEQSETLTMLREIATLTIDLAYRINDVERNKLLYDIQCNLKSITNQYLKNKNELIYQSKDSLLIHWFEQQKSMIVKLEQYSSHDKQIWNDSIKKINEMLHDKYLINRSNIEQVNHTMIMNALKDNEVYIDFFEVVNLLQTSMYAFILSKDTVAVHLVEHYNDALQYISQTSNNYVNNKMANTALFNLLLRPLMPYLHSYDRLYITLDGYYNQVALEILSPNGKLADAPLLKADITYIENGAALLHLQSNKHNKEITPTLLIVGGLDYQCGQANSGYDISISGERNQPQYASLTGSKTEIKAMVDMANQHSYPYTLLTACQATIDTFSVLSQNNRQYNHLHLSTHGYYDQNMGYDHHISERIRYGLVMSKDSLKRQLLSALEISNLNLWHIDHCFLSACNTGLGLYTPGQGHFSVAQAFKIAGVHNVIATLWEIPDVITAEFVAQYYNHYNKHRQPDQAIQFAKEQLRPKYPPKAWAAFRLIH